MCGRDQLVVSALERNPLYRGVGFERVDCTEVLGDPEGRVTLPGCQGNRGGTAILLFI